MGKQTIALEPTDPIAPSTGFVTLYPKTSGGTQEYFFRKPDGAVVRLAGSQIIFGTGAPSGALGSLSDVYVDATNGFVYQKTGPTTWVFIGAFSGVTLATSAPPDIAALGAIGVSIRAAKEDHTHGHGNQAGGSTHAAATTSVAGFLSAPDKVRVDGIETIADGRITLQKGTAGGLATLDGGGKVPASQLPTSVMEFKGLWDASTNTPTLADGTGATGDVYRVSVAGTQNLGSGSLTFEIGDWAIHDGTAWRRSDATDAVTQVNGMTGTVVLTTDNVGEGATNLYFTNARADARIALQKGAANGLATLDAGSKVPVAQLPFVLSAATPAPVAAAGAPGTGANASKEDHVHAHGNQGGGTLHADVVAAAASGFMTGADKTKLDGVAAGATNTPLSAATPQPVGTAAPGVGTSASKNDHVHAHGNQLGGSLHALADAASAGFLSAADFLKLAALYNPVSSFVIDEPFAVQGSTTERIGKYGWLNGSAGTGNNQTPLAGVAGHPGIFRMQGGTVATARSVINLGGAGFHTMVLGGGEILFRGIVRMTGTINTHLQSAIGLGDSFTANGDQANGVYVRLLGTGTVYEIVTASGSVRSAVTLLTYVSGDFVDVGFLINSAGTSVQGLVNGVAAGAPITTNIPAIALSPFIKTDAIAAGTALSWDTDRYFLKQAF